MATSKQQLQEDIPWDIERIPVGIGENASDDALDILDSLDDERLVERVRVYARSETGVDRIGTDHLLTILRRAEGRLALVTWSSFGIASISYLPDQGCYDVGRFKGIEEMQGNQAEFYEQGSKSYVKSTLSWSRPMLVARDECNLLPQVDEAEVVA